MYKSFSVANPDPEMREIRCKIFFFGGLKIRGKGPGPPCPSPGSATDIDSKAMFTPLYPRQGKLSNMYSTNSNGTELEQVVHTHRTSYQSRWLRRFGSLHPNPDSWIFTSVSVDSSSLSYLFTSATVRIPGHTTSNCGTEAIRYVTLQEIGARRQLGFVTVIAPKSPSLRVNRGPIRHAPEE